MSDLSNQIVHFFNLFLADATGADDDDADEEETEASVNTSQACFEVGRCPADQPLKVKSVH